MTTIAYKDGVLAFDSKITSGGGFTGWAIKGIKTKNYIAAAAGAVQDIQAFFDWLMAGGTEETKVKFGLWDREVEVTALVVNSDGQVFFFESRLYPYEIKAMYYAAGSGGDFALGAMAHGASATQALKIAAKLDTYTGGTIKTLTIEDLKPVKPKRTRKK